MTKHFDPSRRQVIFKWLGSAGILGAGAMVWSVHLQGKGSDLTLRPPSADKSFLSTCIRCGLCVEACPYLTLKLASFGSGVKSGTPYFEPRKIPCYMCKDIPCAMACPSGALDIQRLRGKDGEIDIANAKMGVVVIDNTNCLAYGGIACDACYRACPLIDEALVLEYRRDTFTNKHAQALPMINAQFCTGCGMCEKACVTQKPTIRILPREKVLGEVGGHYVRSWKEGDEERIKSNTKTQAPAKNALDYLNDGGL